MIQTVILTYPTMENPSNYTVYRGKFLQIILYGQQYLFRVKQKTVELWENYQVYGRFD